MPKYEVTLNNTEVREVEAQGFSWTDGVVTFYNDEGDFWAINEESVCEVKRLTDEGTLKDMTETVVHRLIEYALKKGVR